jgi:nitroreductase
MTSFKEIVRQRRSIRRFLDKPVPPALLRDILTLSAHAPSSGNTQPWEVVVAQGEKLDLIRAENERRFLAGEPQQLEVSNQFDVTKVTDAWPPVLAKRYQTRGRMVLEAKGIARQDKEARQRYYAEMHRYFDAPVALMIGFHKQLTESYTMYDLGIFSQNLCLVCEEAGLGTCIEAVGVFYPDTIRAHLPVPEHLHLAVAIAVGYPDKEAPINLFERNAFAPLNEWVHGLDLE